MTENYKPEGMLLGTRENDERTSSLDAIRSALINGTIIEGRAVLCDHMHNLIVDIGGYQGIIPREEALFSREGEEQREIAVITRVGKPVCVKVTSVSEDEDGVKIYLSRRLAQKECYESYIKELRAGDVIGAKITHMEPFGCFCDIGCGIISLLAIDCISVSRISHPKERFFVGQYINAIVKRSTAHDGRITLSHKELLGTWEENVALFSQGETVAGIVRSIESYGIFIELSPNLAGLAEWREDVFPGQCAAVYIKSIIPDKMKIKLVIVDNFSCESKMPKARYYIDGGRIDAWRYSPDGCEKIIETVFDDS